MANCPTNKPICFRKGPEDRREKKILKRCNNAEYNIFTALDNAYNIKNNEAGDKTDSQDQCIGSTDCFCTPFDFAWMTAIAEANRRINTSAQTTTAAPSPPIDAAGIASDAKKLLEKENITNYFQKISEIMRKNIKLITKVDPVYAGLFCDCIDAALADAAKDDEKKTTYAEINKKEKEPKKFYALASDPTIQAKALIIYSGVYDLMANEKLQTEVVKTITAAQIEQTLQGAAQEAAQGAAQEAAQGAAQEAAQEASTKKTEMQNDTFLLPEERQRLKGVFNIGNYVLNDSNDFDQHAFTSISELLELFIERTNENVKEGGGTETDDDNTPKKQGFFAKKWNEIKEYKKEHAAMFVCFAFGFIAGLIFPPTAISLVGGVLLGLIGTGIGALLRNRKKKKEQKKVADAKVFLDNQLNYSNNENIDLKNKIKALQEQLAASSGGNNSRIPFRRKKITKKKNKRTYKRKHKKNKRTYNKRKRNQKTTKKL